MNLFKISWANLKEKPLSSFLSGLLMTLGITIISLLLLLSKQLDEQFSKNVRGIDMVLGAKGSPLQLILSSIYQIDSPTGTILMEEAERISRNPLIKMAIPLAMGDNYRSFRIVGTNKKYVDHFQVTVGQGILFRQDMDATIGAQVAESTGLKIGDTFIGLHGLDKAGEEHRDRLYKVVGIFNPSHTVVDQLILTSISSVWAIHEDHEGEGGVVVDDAHEGEYPKEARKITSMLIRFRNPLGMMLARGINTSSTLQAALPSIEINRLFSLLGVGVDTIQGLAVIIMIISGISVFVSLYNSLKERRYEMALMLSMGASRTQLFGMLLLEGMVLALIGFVLGLVFSRVGLLAFSIGVEREFHYSFTNMGILPMEWAVLGVAISLGVLAAALPAFGIYRINISRTLAEG